MPKNGTAPPAIQAIVIGEDPTDCTAIAELIQAMAHEQRWTIKSLRKPLLLRRGTPDQIPGSLDRTAGLLNGLVTNSGECAVFVHEDCDDIEPSHEVRAARIEEGLSSRGFSVHAVVPAWEIEAWWFLFPAEVASLHQQWRAPDEFRDKNVGLIPNAKEALRHSLLRHLSRQARPSAPEYRTSESPEIARRIRRGGNVHHPWAKSGSFDRFRHCVKSAASGTGPSG